MRIGVGKPVTKEQGADHVLSGCPSVIARSSTWSSQEAADAVEVILSDGVAPAMNRVNTRD